MIYSVSFSQLFLGSIADYLLSRTSDFALSEWTVYLPTRRSCMVLEETLFQKNPQTSFILPRIVALGETTPEELILMSSELVEELSLLPAVIRPSRRRLLLATLIEKFRYSERGMGADLALKWADKLTAILDEMRTHDVNLKTLKEIGPVSGHAEHWEKIHTFLSLVSNHWDSILEEEQAVESITWQKRILDAYAHFLKTQGTRKPIMIAGSLGTIPSTANLIQAISKLPNGVVVLPGLEKIKQKEPVSPRHPQFFLFALLEKLDINPCHVEYLTDTQHFDTDTSCHKKSEFQGIEIQCENLSYMEASDQAEEARLVAISIRKALEEGKKKIVCVATDQALLKRINTELEVWDIVPLSPQSRSLIDTNLGSFLHLVTLGLSNPFPVVALASLCKHALSKKTEDWNLFERYILRKWTGSYSLQALDYAVQRAENQMDLDTWNQVADFYNQLKKLLMDRDGTHSLKYYLKKIDTFLRWLAEHDEPAESLFLILCPEEAESFQTLWEDLHKSGDLEIVHPQNLSDVFFTLLQQPYQALVGGHTQEVLLLPPADARFIDADLKILAGLNEGVWPLEPPKDPFFTYNMRQSLKLPPLESKIGQSAHDFLSCLCGPGDKLITRSLRIGGVPSIPSRFLSYLHLGLKRKGLKLHSSNELKQWSRDLYLPPQKITLGIPAPCPPANLRPNRLSVTEIGLLLKDPYSIYAKHILKLTELNFFSNQHQYRSFGIFVHECLHEWNRDFNKTEAPSFLNRAKFLFGLHFGSWEENRFWWEKFLNLLKWVSLQSPWSNTVTEIRGEIVLPIGDHLFTLFGKADRIDWNEQSLRIIDYKTGGVPSGSSVKSGESPQLLLEALIFYKNGFSGLPIAPLTSLEYWGVLTEEKVILKDDLNLFISNIEQRLQKLMTSFLNDSTPYLSYPKGKLSDYSYDHLSRFQEWHMGGH